MYVRTYIHIHRFDEPLYGRFYPLHLRAYQFDVPVGFVVETYLELGCFYNSLSSNKFFA